MTTTKQTAKVTTEVTELDAPAPLLGKQPQAIHLTESVARGLHKLTHLTRQGYLIVSLQCLNSTGMLLATLQLGNPDPELVQDAAKDVQQALDQEVHQRELDIQEAARQLVAAREKAARDAEMQAKVAEAEAALAAIKAAAGAA